MVLEDTAEVGTGARDQHASKEGNSAGFSKPHPKSKCDHVCAVCAVCAMWCWQGGGHPPGKGSLLVLVSCSIPRGRCALSQAHGVLNGKGALVKCVEGSLGRWP